MSPPSFAYVFERFPSFVQTFCLREVQEMIRQGMEPLVYSIRPPELSATTIFPPDIMERVKFLPPDDELRRQVRALREEHKLSSAVWNQFQSWGERGDKTRLYEAAWIGTQLRAAGVRHVHVHFAGIAARAAFWMKRFFGISYSFTGHANDIFCETDFPVTLEDLVRESEFAVTVSEFSRRWLMEKFPSYALKIHRVYNGIEIEKFRTESRTTDPPLIVSVGRYIEKKGFADLIEACRILRNQGLNFECMLVGEGELEKAMKAQIERHGLEANVKVTGPKSEKEVIEVLARANVFTLACRAETGGGMDNLPTVIMEAMAARLPIVSTTIAGVPEMVCEGQSGFLVPEQSPAPLARALSKLISDHSLSQKMGAAARMDAETKFSLPVTAGQLKRLLIGVGKAKLNLDAYRREPGLLAFRVGRLLRR